MIKEVLNCLNQYVTLNQFTKIGDDVIIANGVIVKNGGVVGNHVAIDHGFYCTVPFIMKDYIHISPYCTVIGGKNAFFKMGNFSGLAAGCRIICASDGMMGKGISNPTIPPQYRDEVINKPIILEDFVTVSTNSIICPGVTLGEGTIIGANSLVMGDTKPWSVYVGSPAKFLKERPKGNILNYAAKLGYYTAKPDESRD